MRQITMFCLLLVAVSSCPLFGQDETTPHPDNVAPTTPCEGQTGAQPEAITECQKRETARLFIVLGKPQAALRVLCSTNVAKLAYGPSPAGSPPVSLECLKDTHVGNAKGNQ